MRRRHPQNCGRGAGGRGCNGASARRGDECVLPGILDRLGCLAPSMTAPSSGAARPGRSRKRCRLRLGLMGRWAMAAGGPKVKSTGLWAACLRVMARLVKSSESWVWVSRSQACGGQSAGPLGGGMLPRGARLPGWSNVGQHHAMLYTIGPLSLGRPWVVSCPALGKMTNRGRGPRWPCPAHE